MGKYDHSKHKMMIVIQYEESRIVYLFDDLEAPTSYSCWSRSNINNSVFFFFFSYISLTALQSNCQVHYLLVYIDGISKVGKEFMIINVNRCSNSLHSVSYQSHKIMKQVRKWNRSYGRGQRLKSINFFFKEIVQNEYLILFVKKFSSENITQ
jgi:hypothetical protein